MHEIWILGETHQGRVAPISFELLAWARSLGPGTELKVTALLPGPASDPEELCYRGADRVLHAPDPRLDCLAAAPFAQLVLGLFEKGRPAVLLAAATTTGRTFLPYLAAKANLGLTADCTELRLDLADGSLYQTRPAAGGNIMATILTPEKRPQAATLRPHSRKALARDPGRKAVVEILDCRGLDFSSVPVLVSETAFPESGGLADARIVVSGGRGLRKKEGFALLGRLASKLGAELGASREAVDRGWIDYPHQVGLSGRTISPEVYLAFGISGAIQHLAGMQTAERIAAVDLDPEAPIFGVCDLAIRADLYAFLPRLIAALEAAGPEEE